MIINHNLMANNALRNMNINSNNASKAMEKLSSGLRINRAGDDAAGLAISEKMRGQINGLNQASSNAQDSISLIQTAEGALNETHSILQRMRTLAVQSSNDTNTTTDRTAIQSEINQLTNEIDRIGNTTEFNTKKLLNGEVKGVNAEVKGTAVINNNTTLTDLKISASAGQATAIADKGKVNGAITVTRLNEGTTIGTAGDYEVIGADGNKIAATGNLTFATGEITFKDGQIASGTDINILGSFANMKAGESFTIVLNKHEAATTNTSNAITAQIGANSGQTMQIGIDDMRAAALGVRNASGDAIKVDDKYSANSAVSTIQNAIEKVSSQRSKLGAYQNRLEHTINNLGTSSENLTSAESRIRDVDMASEMSEYSKNNILSQAAQAMLAQANQQPQQVLQLLR
ncbi:flagellin [Clostridium tyrobutyricum]|uniref:flagellin N-terminal helical domain-containing protein n=1 Tax=Clostridium tyrobutyricum TaxID=1519 RepID=UPI001C380F0E|nr:flagellin [Clostridium tyrobutyricum]MBV4416557.1 flagellin [Clostridium tyrobutyricum]